MPQTLFSPSHVPSAASPSVADPAPQARFTLGVFLGVARYEFHMQARRRSMWLIQLLLAPLTFKSVLTILALGHSGSLNATMGDWALSTNTLLPILVGVFLADRIPRDRTSGALDLLDAAPAPPLTRLLAKYAGATVASLLPVLALYTAGVGVLALAWYALAAIPLGIAAFLTINLPGLLFVAAFSVACPALIWPPLYQLLFLGYYVWGNFLTSSVGIPSLSGTLLTPEGAYRSAAFFGYDPPGDFIGLTRGLLIRRYLVPADATLWQGVASIALLLLCAALVLIGAWRYLLWRRARE